VELAAAVHEARAVELSERLSAAQRRLVDGRLVVVVVVLGEFKRGKSTLLNALMAEPDLFPVDTYVATRMITTASWAATEKITVTVGDDQLGQREITRAEIAQYAAEAPAGGQPAYAGDTKTVRIEIPNERLANGLVLVDTPGIGGIYQAHTAVTLAFLPSANAVVYAVDASQPLLAGELAFVQQAAVAVDAQHNPDALLFVVTKVDTVADPGPIVEDTRKQLAAATGIPADQLTIIPVSSTAQLRYLAYADPEDREASNFDVLEATLWQALGRSQARLQLGAALAESEAARRR
jgi:predicted GTPase